MAGRASDTTEYQPLNSKQGYNDLPRIKYDMREHKLAIIITWTILFISSGISPIALYFGLRYGAHLALGTSELLH